MVAGVPPDYFSATGQLWGNPLYRWEHHKIERVRLVDRAHASRSLQLDIIRLDHFRGFAGYWEVPLASDHRRKGRWVRGPGDRALSERCKRAGDLPIIAEDLGEITPDVSDCAIRSAAGHEDPRSLPSAATRRSLPAPQLPPTVWLTPEPTITIPPAAGTPRSRK